MQVLNVHGAVACGEMLASFPGHRPSLALPYCKRRKAGRWPGNEASEMCMEQLHDCGEMCMEQLHVHVIRM